MAVELISEIKQKNNQPFALVDSNNIRGGCYSVETIEERDNIPKDRRKIGMLCYVKNEDSYYTLSTNEWQEAKFGGDGIPMLDQETIDSLRNENKLPEKYIEIPNITDLNGATTSKEITETGTYVGILFSAIRKLQSEIAKIKNSFNYGLYSYTDRNTAMSRQLKGMTKPEEEPLWCIDESDLSEIEDVEIIDAGQLETNGTINSSTEGILDINGTATWTDKNKLSNVSDPKLFTYITSNNLNIEITLEDINHVTKVIDLSKLVDKTVNLYNTMICINRNFSKKTNSYIYISIGNAERNNILSEGYLNNKNQLQQYISIIDNNFYIKSISFTDLKLSKCNFYSKYQDFSNQVIPSIPSDDEYKYGVAHITIRSVKNKQILDEIQQQLPNNELIFVEDTKKLWIKNNNNLINIGSNSGTNDNDGMTESEIISLLKRMGIVAVESSKTDDSGNIIYTDLKINDISDITFINEDTKTRYKFKVDSEGNLTGRELPDESDLLENKSKNLDIKSQYVRGIIAQINNPNGDVSKDYKLKSDRVKIGAFYAPLNTDTIFGCSRAFIELENTSNVDIPLQGCYLHFAGYDNDNQQTVYHLALTGILKAGGTYLIVGKKYANNNDSNVYLKIDSFDQEWFVNGNLIDFTCDQSKSYGFALTFGNENLNYNDRLIKSSTQDFLNDIKQGLSMKAFPYNVDKSFIDAIYFNTVIEDSSNDPYWIGTRTIPKIKPNSFYKNTFELDPAKQAFNALTTVDSSRIRWNNSNDYMIVNMDDKYIKFPHSEDIYDISKFTPKSSKQNKNVCTDKSKLDNMKPNMVTCSFGLNLHTDRCFNWVSVGYFDEYVFIRKKGSEEWTKFESYKYISDKQSELSTCPHRKEYEVNTNNIIYKRITGRFPADNTFYTSHKCVLKILSQAPSSPEEWEYCVGRCDKFGNPDTEHSSSIQIFTLYPTTYTPRIYQVTDQQGFHWIEYQVWAAAANKIKEKIKSDKSKSHIIPILINTGDMTQNGTRINEWYDYYQAGKTLFSEYEQMNVVGNNDLCGTNYEELGTGDDSGKSNSFYFHVFYCYDIDESILPIVNNKYIPSLYYFDSDKFRFIMVNSEITEINCQDWFELTHNINTGTDTTTKAINIYTGFCNNEYVANGIFTPIYTMVYNMLNTDKKCIVACHEMPFTVITNGELDTSKKNIYRSISSNKLIGSHLNQFNVSESDPADGNPKGIYWFSRLLEFKNVKLCIGGHKHTYSCTYPIREYFKFGNNKNSKDNYNEYKMNETLEEDDVIWMDGENNLTKIPLVQRKDPGTPVGIFYPCTPVNSLEHGVTYFMCQATGFKLTSNKELPSANQKFSMAIPKTTNTSDSDKPNSDQKYPMFGIIELEDGYKIKLSRIKNILNEQQKFTQFDYSTDNMELEYFETIQENDYGNWSTTEKYLTILS